MWLWTPWSRQDSLKRRPLCFCGSLRVMIMLYHPMSHTCVKLEKYWGEMTGGITQNVPKLKFVATAAAAMLMSVARNIHQPEMSIMIWYYTKMTICFWFENLIWAKKIKWEIQLSLLCKQSITETETLIIFSRGDVCQHWENIVVLSSADSCKKSWELTMAKSRFFSAESLSFSRILYFPHQKRELLAWLGTKNFSTVCNLKLSVDLGAWWETKHLESQLKNIITVKHKLYLS